MTHFEDLSPYQYWGGRRTVIPGTLNVGWLSSEHQFNVGAIDQALLEKLWAFCTISVNQTRGYHECEFCDCDRDTWFKEERYVYVRNNREVELGSAEILVIPPSGPAFAAPSLIFHYVETHNYLPSEEFLDALSTSICPPDPAYTALLDKHGIEWKDWEVIMKRAKEKGLID